MTTRDISKKREAKKFWLLRNSLLTGTSPPAGKMVSKEFFLTMRMWYGISFQSIRRGTWEKNEDIQVPPGPFPGWKRITCLHWERGMQIIKRKVDSNLHLHRLQGGQEAEELSGQKTEMTGHAFSQSVPRDSRLIFAAGWSWLWRGMPSWRRAPFLVHKTNRPEMNRLI